MMTTLLDEMLPRADVGLRHGAMLRVPAERAFRATCDLDVARHRLVRALVATRALPLGGAGPRTLRIADLTGPDFGWLRLGERPGTELVVGTLARPWRIGEPSPPQPGTPEEFTAFAAPGFVKVVLSVRAVPQGPDATVLTVETRVAATDPASARRFRRYWRLVGPFSELIRRIAVAMLARELDPAARNGGEILVARPAETVFDAVADERTEPRYNPQIHDVELLTQEPLGVGTRFRARAGRAPMTIETTGYDRPRRFDSTTRMGPMDIDYTLTFEPVEAGTRMHWLFELHPRGALRALRPAVQAIGRRQEQRNWTLLRRYLESGERIVTVPGPYGPLPAYLATPPGTGPWPGLVVLHDAFGIDAAVREQADRLAAAGYLTLSVDLCAGRPAPVCLARMFADLRARRGRTFEQIDAARTWLAARPGCTGRLGVLGFCATGGFALLLAAGHGYAVAGVNYGSVPADAEQALRGACPVVASYGGRDRSLPGAARRLDNALNGLGVEHDVVEYPDAGHAFLHPNSGEPGPVGALLQRCIHSGYHEPSAQDAWRRILAFLDEHLR